MSIRKSIRLTLEYVFEKFGLIVIPRWRIDAFLLTIRLKRIIVEYRIDCIIDVGANVGQYAKYLRNEVGYKGLIISFEPDPKNIKLLKESSKLDNLWIIKDFALGKQNEVLKFNIMEKSEFNSFLEPDHTETSLYHETNSVKQTIDVPVRRLDEIIAALNNSFNIERIFLKLDTQGFDLDVFLGASDCLNLITGVQTEVSVLPIYKHMPTFNDSLELFRSNGFEVSGLYAVSESRFPHAIEFDCVYLPKD